MSPHSKAVPGSNLLADWSLFSVQCWHVLSFLLHYKDMQTKLSWYYKLPPVVNVNGYLSVDNLPWVYTPFLSEDRCSRLQFPPPMTLNTQFR